MKKVIIPSSSKPFVVDINGKKYTYQAGTEQEVPDEVAVIIEAYYEHHTAKPEETNPPFSSGVSSWNDLTDKPFGESDNAVLLPPTQFAYDSAFGLFAVPGYIDFVEGKTYTVNWNGVDYTTEAVPGQFNGESLVIVGNPAALGGTNNNLPFAVACLMGSIGAIPLDGSAAVTVGITGYLFAKIPAMYMYKYVIDIPYGTTIDNGVVYLTMDTTMLVDAILNGFPVYVDMNGGFMLRCNANSFIFAGDVGDNTVSFETAINKWVRLYGKINVPLTIEAATHNGVGVNVAVNVSKNQG